MFGLHRSILTCSVRRHCLKVTKQASRGLKGEVVSIRTSEALKGEAGSKQWSVVGLREDGGGAFKREASGGLGWLQIKVSALIEAIQDAAGPAYHGQGREDAQRGL